MSSVQSDKVCPNCGYEEGIYELNCRTNEEWFVCEKCGWGYEINARRFGESLLSELRDTVGRVGAWHKKWPLIDAILRDLSAECEKHGRNDTDSCVHDIHVVLSKSLAERGEEDKASIKSLTSYYSLFALKDGEVILEYIEKPPRMVSIPLSPLRPMSQLPGIIGGREDPAKGP